MRRDEKVSTIQYEDNGVIISHDYNILGQHRLRVDEEAGQWVGAKELATIKTLGIEYIAISPYATERVWRATELKRV